MEGDGRNTLIFWPLNRIREFYRSEFFRYIVSGSLAFICDFSVLVFSTEVLGAHYLVSNIGGYLSGMIVSYFINIRWVFRNRRFVSTQGWEFIYFTLIVFAGLALSELILYTMTEFVEVHYTISKIASTCFVFLFNFIVKKWLLFP